VPAVSVSRSRGHVRLARERFIACTRKEVDITMTMSLTDYMPRRRARPSSWRAGLAAAAIVLAGAFGISNTAWAASETEDIVDASRLSLDRLLRDKDMANFRSVLSRARGVLIVPELVKGGFIVGAEGGTGVFLVRGADGTWSPPAFYTLAAGSLGLQIGVQVSEVVFTLMNEGAVNALMKNEVKLGADLSVTAGPLGAGVEASTTTNMDADIYAYSHSAGLFGGGALEGAKIIVRKKLNAAYYGSPAPVRDIVINRKFFNPQADPLRKLLQQQK
jgi:lipid-binding SYLF domain-containing protein